MSKDHATLSPPPLESFFYFGPCWATLPLRQQTLHNGVPRVLHETGRPYSPQGGGGGGKGFVRGGGGGCSDVGAGEGETSIPGFRCAGANGGGGEVTKGVLGGNQWVGGGGGMAKSSHQLGLEICHPKRRVEWSSLSGLSNS